MSIYPYKNYIPVIHPTAFVADSANVIGRVTLEENVSIWHNSVLRADINFIQIGKGSNIQDLCVLHVANEHPCIVDENVTIGHRVVLHGCHIQSGCTIGIGAIILNGVVIEKNVVLGAGSLVTENTYIPEGSLAYGSPAKVIRKLTSDEITQSHHWGHKYIRVKEDYQS